MPETDERAKNTYPYCFGTETSRWRWRVDDARILVLTQLIEDFLTKNIVLKRTIWMKPELQFGMAKRITSLI